MVIIGAGIGGLACAARLAAAGTRVTVIEAQPTPGGKLRQLSVGGLAIDGGPTVFTMRWVFDELFAACNARLDAAVKLDRLEVLARHAWAGNDGQPATLDLFADRARAADAIGTFAGAAEARGYLAFTERSRRIYRTLEHSFIRGERPSLASLIAGAGFAGLPGLARLSPFTTLWNALGAHFRDPRLRQLFGRYATYCGASPLQAPATLMLVAHVEQAGVWTIAGGMHHLARAVADLAARHGAVFRYGTRVDQIRVQAGAATGVKLASGESIAADAVVLNADAAALAAGLFGTKATAAIPAAPAPRSLSALSWAIAGRPRGFPLLRHNVFFSADYKAEFDQIGAGRVPSHPSVYLCAADRGDRAAPVPTPERLFAIVNAPADGDRHTYGPQDTEDVLRTVTSLLGDCGLELTCEASSVTTPTDYARLFPATGGALYGPATHGAMASFRRPGARTRIPNLYLTGGSVHPGPGVPMAALSGRLAANNVQQDGVSTSLSRPVAIAGGISTR